MGWCKQTKSLSGLADTENGHIHKTPFRIPVKSTNGSGIHPTTDSGSYRPAQFLLAGAKRRRTPFVT